MYGSASRRTARRLRARLPAALPQDSDKNCHRDGGTRTNLHCGSSSVGTTSESAALSFQCHNYLRPSLPVPDIADGLWADSVHLSHKRALPCHKMSSWAFRRTRGPQQIDGFRLISCQNHQKWISGLFFVRLWFLRFRFLSLNVLHAGS